MDKAFSAALLAGGVALIYFGVKASHSLGSDFSRLFTGNPTDKTMWMLVGGLALSVVGILGLARRRKSYR